MFRYRNVNTGRVIERAVQDEWLEASSGWTTEEPEATADNEEKEND